MSSDANAAYDELRRRGHEGWGGAKFQERISGWRRELTSWLSDSRFPRGGRLLELGCGNGAVTSLFALHGYEVTGIDISESAVAWAHELFRGRGLVAEFYCDDVSRGLPRFEDRRFKVVIDGNCLHCVLGQPRSEVLGTVRRLLGTEGVFVVSSMCGVPRSPEAIREFHPDSQCLWRDGRPYRYLPPAASLVDEIVGAGFQPLSWRVQENAWWDHLWMVAATR
jgi:SAM-dependent methyltransferase